MIEPQDTPTSDELEKLFVNNEELDQINAHLSRFNPIRVMKMESMEVRHSAILAWLLNPSETHGFGDRFLRAFLAEALRGHSASGSPTALDIIQSDLRDAEIRPEWQDIDIFVLSRNNNWAFVIEVKWNSKQHEGQLTKYIEKVKAFFEPQGDTLAVKGIFLTLLEEEPQDVRYAPLRYAAVSEILPGLIARGGTSISSEALIFLKHYLEIVEDATGMSDESNEMIELARQLYRTHKKVLDFIVEHGAITDFIIAAETLFGTEWESGEEIVHGKQKYIYNGHSINQFSFLPVSWAEGFGYELSWPGCEGWWAEYPLICWFQLFEDDDSRSGRLRLFAEVGPLSSHEFRKSLVEDIKTTCDAAGIENVKFQKGAELEGKKYSKFLRGNNNIDISDVSDAEEISRAMALLLKRFQSCFDAIGAVLPKYREYGEDTE